MKYRLMDLLACPMCKHFPLKLIVFEETGIEKPERIRKCELYCGYHQAMVEDLSELSCEDCWSREIVSGILICEECGRWYPIEEEIPRMLPDDLRDRNKDLSFLSRWRSRIPEKILREGKPFNLGNP